MGARASRRDTVVIVKDVANAMGAHVLEVNRASRHPRIRIRTREGVEFWMRVKQGKIEPYKQRGWIRQSINRANRANDNGKNAQPVTRSHK